MSPEQAALLHKAQESQRAARLLADQEFYDFAVSRAYYAMFYIVEAFLLGEGLAFSKHSAVISEYGQRFAKPERVPRKFHRYLIEGADSRNAGDYDIGPGLSKAEAELRLQLQALSGKAGWRGSGASQSRDKALVCWKLWLGLSLRWTDSLQLFFQPLCKEEFQQTLVWHISLVGEDL